MNVWARSPGENASRRIANPLDPRRAALWRIDEDGQRELTLPPFEHDPLNHDADEQRFLKLAPFQGDHDDIANHVSVQMETFPLFNAPVFLAITNARGYRLLEEPIDINGKACLVSAALEKFLRHFRTIIDNPIYIWTRWLCVAQADPEERRYWTRDFCDMMYALAAEVVDMSEYNAPLVEDGIMEKVHDARHSTWRKEWNALPEKFVMPSVFPIRLGKRLSNNAPVDDYEYLPLDMVADEIRVLVLVPSEDPSAPIVVHAGHCPIHCDVTYTALSYRWGDDLSTAEVILNGQKKAIRKSLEETLRALRRPNQHISIWIDQISINQGDVLERSRQVARIGEIFDNACGVINYIGPKTDDSDLALELVQELKGPMMRINDHGEWHFGPWGSRDQDDGGGLWYGENRIGPARLARMCAALYKLFTRPYFRRTWILQELAFASNPTIGVGDRFDTSFERFDFAAYHLVDMLRNDPRLAGQMMEADPSLQRVDQIELAFVRKLFYFRHLACRGVNDTLIFLGGRIRDDAPGFLEALILARDFRCTDARDKIFAIWNLVRDKSNLHFICDYSMSVRDVYVTFVRAWIMQHGSLDMLAAVEPSKFYESAPSWCPDWSIPSISSCLVRRECIPVLFMAGVGDQDGKLYSADGDIQSDSFEPPIYEFNGDNLCCTGIILDQIQIVLEDTPPMPDEMRLPSCDPLSYHQFHSWTTALTRYFQAEDIHTYEDPLQAAVAMFHGDVLDAWLPRAAHPENWSDILPDEQYVCVPRTQDLDLSRKQSRHVNAYGGSYNRANAWDVVRMMLRGRRPFVSKAGYMGLAPWIVSTDVSEKPWLLAIVAGCSVPLLLREREGGSYGLYGTCFVQGWMEGEVLTGEMGADSPKQFWEALIGAEKIRIS